MFPLLCVSVLFWLVSIPSKISEIIDDAPISKTVIVVSNELPMRRGRSNEAFETFTY
jgi:hypothetical protein